MSDSATPPRDAFRDRLARAGAETGRPELAHQSLGRALTEAEGAFADALMAIYAAGVQDPADVAQALTDRGVIAPASGVTAWTETLMEDELRGLNADLDAAYQERGYGA